MHTQPEFAEEHTQAERIRFVVIGTLTGALVVFSSKAWLFPWFREFAAAAPCRTVFGIEGVTVLWYGLFVGLPLHAAVLVAATFGRRGYKVLRDGQFPPAKEKVYRQTKIRRGSKAKRIGYLHLSAFLPLLALTVWGGFQAAEMSRTTRPKVGTCAANTAVSSDAPQAVLPRAPRSSSLR